MSGTRFCLAVLVVLLNVGQTAATPVQWKVEDGGNGHYYEYAKPSGGINWSDANAIAEDSSYLGFNGHLVTITSAAENSFITSRLPIWAWIGLTDAREEGVWEWITGEPFSYSNWDRYEPNNSDGNEDYVHYSDPWGYVRWNDLPDRKTYAGGVTLGYIVEYEPVPEPSTFVLLGMGAVGLLAWTRRRRRNRTTRRPTGPVSATLACVLLGSLGGSATAAPVSPWIVNPANNHSYALLGQSDWINSEVAAISLGGHLTAINDAAEQAWVFQTFGRWGGTSRLLWMGLNDADRQGTFGFSNGDALTYNHWASGEPNGGGSEDYVAMYYPGHSQQGRWNDWGHRSGDPIGVPFHGVVEITGEPQPPLFELGTDSSWLAMAPEGNREGQPIHSVGSAFEAANPGWKSDLTLDTSVWSSAQPRPGGAIWGPGADTPVYLRKTFTLSDPVEDVMLLAIADDDALIYINGSLVVSDANGLSSGLGPIDVTDYLLPGENLIAVKAHDSYGVGETLYVRLVGTVVPEPSTLVLLAIGAAGLLMCVWRKRKRG